MATKKSDLQSTMRDLVMRALDTAAEKLGAAADQPAGTKTSALQRLAGSWKSLDDEQRDRIATQIATATEAAAAAIPVAATAVASRATAAIKRATKKRTAKNDEEERSILAERVIIEPVADVDLEKEKKKKKKDKGETKDKKGKKDKDKKKKKKKK